MKRLLTALAIAGIFVLTLTASAKAAPFLDQFGKVELSAGGEKEAGAHSGGRFTMEGLGVLPLMGNFGVQGALHYVTGLGSRVGFNLGPVFGWDGGKVGAFISYQHRGMRGTDFVHVIPSIAIYLPQANLNLWYAQPTSGAQRGGHRVEYAINKLQGTASFFAGSDWWAPYLKKDNVELLLGLQVNSFAGAGQSKAGGTGFGPVAGASVLVLPGVAVNLLRLTFDHHSRYRVATGLEFFFDPKGNTTLKDERRKYLEPNFEGPGSGAEVSSNGHDCRKCGSDRNIKANIEPVDQKEILARVAKMPIQKWNYKADDPSVRHIGPMAQDFHAAFDVGDSDKTIYTVDGNGIALASIQALYQMIQDKDQRIAALESKIALLDRSENGSRGSWATNLASGWPLIALVAGGGFFIARRRKDTN